MPVLNPSGVVPEDPKTPGESVSGRPPRKLESPPEDEEAFLRSVRLMSSLMRESSSSSLALAPFAPLLFVAEDDEADDGPEEGWCCPCC